jgi:hypothetical protein
VAENRKSLSFSEEKVLFLSCIYEIILNFAARNTKGYMCKLKIKEIAREKHVMMQQLAKACGYRQASSLNQAMSRGLKVQQLEDIANTLGVDVPDLFERTRTTIQCPHCGKVFTIKTEE